MNETFEDAFSELSGTRLIVGNSCFRRTLDLTDGVARTVRLEDAAGRVFGAETCDEADFYFIGLNRPGADRSQYRVVRCEAERVAKSIFDGAHLLVTLEVMDDVQQLVLRREFRIYPGLPVLSMRNAVKTPVMPNCYWGYRAALNPTGWRNRGRFVPAHLESSGDAVTLADGLTVRESVRFTASTDYTDDLVCVEAVGDRSECNGSLCYAEADEGYGLWYLQEAPPEEEKRDFEPYDFRISGRTLRSCTWGIAPGEVGGNRWMTGYRHVLGLFHDATEKERVLKDYLAVRFPDSPRHRSVMVNAWGCGCFPKLVSPDFLCAEMAAAAELGATHYQIDDSWQEGEGLGEMSLRNRLMTPEFWQVSQRRMGGTFDRVLSAAREAGIEPALWIAPSANAEYRDWREFARILLEFHRREGFNLFKIDGTLIRSYEAEENLESLLREVREATGGEVYFNLDTTNGQRPGYFRFLEYGNIFLENRYVCHEWGKGYHPEKTLRALWRLGRFMRVQNLQIEIPSPADVNTAFYAKNGMCDPRIYPLEYWAALSLFASPLLWLAPSRVPAELRGRYRAMMELHRRYRDEIFAGRISSVGREPDGNALTGFYSDSGFLIAYRERGAYAPSAEFSIPGGEYELLGGAGSVTGTCVTVAERPGFAFFRRLG